MILHAEFKTNIVTGSLTEQKYIPCIIHVSNKFEIIFETVDPKVIGEVTHWDRTLFEKRAIPSVGGTYTHIEPALISLKMIGENSYKITYLSIFYNNYGWLPVIENGEYAPPNNCWYDNDDEDPDYVPKG